MSDSGQPTAPVAEFPGVGSTLSLLFDYRGMPWIERAEVAAADEQGMDLVRGDAGALDVLLSCARVEAMYAVDDGVMRWSLAPAEEGASGPMLRALAPPSRGERRGFVRATLPVEVRLPGRSSAKASGRDAADEDLFAGQPWKRVDADLSATGIRWTHDDGQRLRGRVSVQLRPLPRAGQDAEDEDRDGLITIDARVVRSTATDDGCELACAYDTIDARGQQRVMGWVHAARAAALSDLA